MSATDSGLAATAGAVAGLAALAAFLAIHHAWITPIWFIAPVGVLVAAGGGAVVGASYAELLSRLPRRPWRSVAVAGIYGSILGPGVLIAELTGPMFVMDGDGGGTLLVPAGEAIAAFVVGLVGSAVATGAVVGVAVGRSARAAGWTAGAALALALGPGHNVPFLGGTPAAGKGVVLLLAVLAIGSIVLVETHAALATRRHRTPRGARTAGSADPDQDAASSPGRSAQLTRRCRGGSRWRRAGRSPGHRP